MRVKVAGRSCGKTEFMGLIREAYERGKKDAVVHARWEVDEEGNCKCTACGEWQSYPDKYCRECGAKMDEEANKK